ncbi:hypothetical protein [Kitasatospora brasiliensis]|uniref:hypothetical protein n=1 Tax=Kitasatospora brasiliensis TaxID=3058040 RepID=UPI002930BEE6|nr:hypothetical protein [Kitasatospora sp. K002]
MDGSVHHESWLRGVAANPGAPSDVLLRLLAPAGRAAVDRVLGPTGGGVGPVDEMIDEPELGWYEACAGSPHPGLRRVAATCPRLPEELVHRLAGDRDDLVRHLPACNHPPAPPATVLAAFLAVPRQRPYLLSPARLPRTGLGHLLDHEDPEVRAPAAADTGLAEPPVRLLGDPDPRVRRAAAANRLLPLGLVEPLLEQRELAEGAAANPGLSEARLHALLDRAGLPRIARQPGGQ